jgi:HAD superfamily hydrolase (TIGR01509 family)
MSGSVLGFDAYIIDLDGVLTDTTTLHARSWKFLFDGFFESFAEANGVRPFRVCEDYARYIRGRNHADGLRGFLASRGLELPDGCPGDPPEAPTVHALARRKSQIFARMVEERGVSVFAGSQRFLDHLRTLTRPTALVTASRNGELVLDRAGLGQRFDVVVDGRVAERERLAGQPAPDCFLFAAAWLGIDPAWTVVIEATEAGVKAARQGGFGCVVGVLRGSSQAALRAAGADLVVADLANLL